MLAALDFYVERGGGSRGARTVCDPKGDQVPHSRTGPLEDFRFLSERAQDRAEQILVRVERERFVIWTRSLRVSVPGERPFFERNWPDFLTGTIYE